MSATRPAPILDTLHQLLRARRAAGTGDRELLARLVAGRDDAAFTELVRRYGPMVWGVCRRVLRHEQDAEDAFQATFVVLARKAGTVRAGSSLASWLYGVAHRVAVRARADAARRRRHECAAALPAGATADLRWDDVRAVLDEELARLPEHYRAPLLLCYLEGLTQDEAARALGWSDGTLRGRLQRGRERLRARLSRRGLSLSAALCAGTLAADAAAAPPTALVAAALRAAARDRTGRVAALAASAAQGVTPGWVKFAAPLLLAVAVVAGVGALAYPGGRVEKRGPDQSSVGPAVDEKKPADRHGDPLPDGAIARLGTLRWRHGERVMGIAFSPDGKNLASASADGTLGLWDIATGKRLRTFRGHKDWVTCVLFTPDGKKLVSAGFDNIRLWDVNTAKELRQFRHSGGVWQVALSRDARLLAALGPTGVKFHIALWDVATGAKARELELEGDFDGAMSLAFSPDGKKLLSGGDRVLRQFDVTTGKQLDLFGAGRQTRRLAFAPDGKTFAVGRHDAVARIYDAQKLKVLHELPGHKYLVRCLVYSPDGKTLITADGDNTVRLWDAATGKKLRDVTADDSVECVAVSPDGATLATGTLGSTIALWDAATGKRRGEVAGHQSWLGFVAFADKNRTVLSVDMNGSIRRWDAATGKELPAPAIERFYTGPAALSPNRRTLALGGAPGIRLDDLEAGKQVLKLKGHQRQLWGLAFSPRGDVLASVAFLDRSVRLWDPATGKELRQIVTKHQNQPRCLAYSPDGKVLATGGEYDNTLCLWDADTGKLLRQWAGHDKSKERHVRGVIAVAFSPDGKLLASSGADWTVRLWDATTGKPIYRLGGNDQAAGPLVFSADGRVLASGSSDNIVRLWEVATGRERRRLTGHLGHVSHLAFSADGRALVTASMDTTLLVWSVGARDPWRPAPERVLSADAAKRAWDELASGDAAAAFRAVRALTAAPKQALPLLRDRLAKEWAVDDRQVAKWVSDLDSDEFAVRDRAAKELDMLGELAESALRKAMTGRPSAEVRLRVRRLLHRLEGPVATPRVLRGIRAVEVLEGIGTDEARRLLERLAKEASAPRLVRESRAALDRPAKRDADRP
jgi:RNA polymerase sigma factor (sigma-70 family)